MSQTILNKCIAAVRRGLAWCLRSKMVFFAAAVVLVLIIVVRLLKFFFLNI